MTDSGVVGKEGILRLLRGLVILQPTVLRFRSTFRGERERLRGSKRGGAERGGMEKWMTLRDLRLASS